MKAKKIWIAEHPNEPFNREVSFNSNSAGEYVHIDPTMHGNESAYVEYVEHIAIPIES